MQRYYLFILGLIVTFSVTAANRLVMPSTCGFEVNEDLSDWTLNAKTPEAYDQWCIGSATHSEGQQALYISMDTCYNARYGNRPNTVCAYRTFRYPISSKTEKYDISFDWRNFGDRKKGRLHVSYFRSSQLATRLAMMSETSGMTYSDDENYWGMYFEDVITGNDTSRVLYNNEAWQTSTLRTRVIPANQDDEYVLMFVWVNQFKDTKEDSTMVFRLGACIDNIQITSNRAQRPFNVAAEVNCMDSTLVITWQSTMDEFALMYKSNVDEQWHRQEGITDRVATHSEGLNWSYSLPYMTEGIYDIKLRSVNAKDASQIDSSGWVTIKDIVNYCPDNHCIDYMHLDAANVTCTYGVYADPYQHIGIVDYGSMEKQSRHTIVSDMNAYDERTNFKLKMVPTNALASVRLGNWDIFAEGETVTYEYTVDTTDAGVLLLNYAIVLEDPQHDSIDQPYFSLRVLDENGTLIDGSCGMAEYYAGHGAGEWTTETYIEHTATGAESHNIVWKNWSTVGFNLRDYHNQKVRVELTTKDCNHGAHYGYAYFTLDCANGRISTNNCTMAAYSEATAPEGFAYEWRRVADGTFYGNERTIRVDASDPSPYSCKCMFLENRNCYFKLQTFFQPQYPVASFMPVQNTVSCTSELKLVNNSYIVYTEEGEEKIATAKPKDYEWRISTSSGQKFVTSTPTQTVNCNPRGDTVSVMLLAYLSSKQCCDSAFQTIVMPDIITPDSVLTKDLCRGGWVEFDGTYYTQTGSYVHPHKNQYGCDSILRLNLTIHEPPEPTYIEDSICSSHPYHLGNLVLTESGIYSYTFYNQYMCDSTVYLTLTAYQQPQATIPAIGTVCSDDGNVHFSYTLKGTATRIDLLFDNKAHQAGWEDVSTTNVVENGTIHYPFTDSVLVGQFTPKMVFKAEGLCTDDVHEVPFTLNYRSSIMEQKWNDVVTLLNDKYNGGYTFSHIQWYRNGQKLDGQTGPYIYLPEVMQTGDEIYAELTNQYGETVHTCPIRITNHSEQGEHPSIRKQLYKGRLQIQVNDNTYDAQGIFITTNR